ncbi:GntR family transcriptional regulator [Hoeflea sp.]|uniref:GntR family transcriptional regulator n=1 Tax=Hoeflea sp. TaxID=1940281 RepID=UPI003B52A309
MRDPEIKSWQAVQAEVLRRINSREWKPGEFIPHEAELSREFGCARATVNRALRGLAESGLLDRRRKAGTRVALHPVRKATLAIPVIRLEIESKGQSYRHQVLTRGPAVPPAGIRARMRTEPGVKLMHLVTLHMADGKPYVFGDRWINPEAAPGIETADLTSLSANEWLVRNIPFEGGDFTFSAMTAGSREAEILACPEGEGLFVIERSTWNQAQVITSVRLTFSPGYRMHTEI